MLLLLLCTEAVISKKPWTKSQAVRTHNLSETTRRPLQGISQFYRISLHTSSIIGICLHVLPQGSVQQSSERQDLWSVKASTIKIQRCKSTSRFRAQRLFDHTSIQKRGAVNGCCCQLSSVMSKSFTRPDDREAVAFSQIICRSPLEHVSRLTNHILCLLIMTNYRSNHSNDDDIAGRLSLALGSSVLGEAITRAAVGRAIGVAVVVRAVAVSLELAYCPRPRGENGILTCWSSGRSCRWRHQSRSRERSSGCPRCLYRWTCIRTKNRYRRKWKWSWSWNWCWCWRQSSSWKSCWKTS